MLKALIKKELSQLNYFYFYNSKNKKLKSKGAIAGTILLVLFLFCSLAMAFFGMSLLLFDTFHPIGLDWLYFSFTGLVAIVLGVFGDVFNTYSQLYKAKDNELLISMPIPPSKLLFARILGVYVMGFLYSSVVFIPSMIVYWTHVPFSAYGIIAPVVLWFCIGIFVAVLTCALGWVVALITSKIHGKAYTRALATLLFLAVYYVVYFKAINGMEEWLTHTDEIAGAVSGWTFLLYHMGLGAAGDVVSLLIYVASVLVLFAITCYILNISYIKMVTTNKGTKKTIYHSSNSKKSTAFRALVRKERQHFLNNSTYLLNMGLGLVIMVAGAVVLIVKQTAIRELLVFIPSIAQELPWIEGAVPVALLVAQMLLISMCGISAPSVSLEGNSIWILQSSPVTGSKILTAKIGNHIMLCAVPVLIISTAIAFVFQLGIGVGLLSVAASLAYMLFTAVVGVCLDNARANLNWTSEVYPVKQGFSITVIILGGWGLSVLTGGLYFLLRNIVSGPLYLGLFILVLLVSGLFLFKRLITKGAARFAFLS